MNHSPVKIGMHPRLILHVVSFFALCLASAVQCVSAQPARLQTENADAKYSGITAVGGAHESPQQRRRGSGSERGVYKAQVTPHWLDGNTNFWYQNDLPDGAKEFILVDAEKGTRAPAFDHARVAQALAKETGKSVDAKKLPITSLDFSPDEQSVELLTANLAWKLDLKSYGLTRVGDSTSPARLPVSHAPHPSADSTDETEISFVNHLKQTVEVFWIDGDGQRHPYGSLKSGESRDQHTYAGHVWLVAAESGDVIAVFEAQPTRGLAVVGEVAETLPPSKNDEQSAALFLEKARSPDGNWNAFIKDNDVYIRSAKDGQEVQLSHDGATNQQYQLPEWSPDSKTLICWRVEPGDIGDVYLVQSSPPNGGRAVLHTRPYAQAGDRFPLYELNLFQLADHKQIKPEVDRFEHEWETPQLHWEKDNVHFTYQQEDRGHQRIRLIEVDDRTGALRNLVDEHTKTFIWTTHMEGPEGLGIHLFNYLKDSDEIVYASERDGWRHLYMIDPKVGGITNQITKGEWVVRGINFIDEGRRQIYFLGSGMNPDQDPYFLQYYRINFDGTGLVALTEGNGNHTVQFSPDRKYLVDTYSRVDMAPVNELRRCSDGALVCKLEEADISELSAMGWEPPEVFVAKGRDGKTDIWGNIYRPRNLDPSKKYPVIEDIYAGPQDSYTPKSFSARDRYSWYNEHGFIVVELDGMGTANRSKAFHDVCWHNLKDAGFPDRILWIKAAAAKHPYLDLDRVGLFGTSAGGQSAAGALLFHNDFYKVAVANCGCHDNRLDKASWNEQWMGYLPHDKLWSHDPDNWYSQNSNIDNAARLKGKLLLIVGEMDSNVPPESTMRLVDALIQAQKNFDMFVVPNANHGAGSWITQRKTHDFFLANLLHENLSAEEAPESKAN